MARVVIDPDKCIACGICTQDCCMHNLTVKEGICQLKKPCVCCGHCLALCPVQAISIEGYPNDDIEQHRLYSISSAEMLNSIKSRRSIRHFDSRPVTKELLQHMLEAGRHAPTGGNRQQVGYIVIQDKMPEIKELLWEGLDSMGEYYISSGWTHTDPMQNKYPRLWRSMYRLHQQNTAPDELFFDAPVLLIIRCVDLSDGYIASAYIDMMANSYNLGCLYSGFLEQAIRGSKQAQELLNISEQDNLICLLLGYPDKNISYLRTPPRKSSDILWM